MIARGGRIPVVSRSTLQELLEENALLHEENAELRMERQRAMSPTDVVARLRAMVAGSNDANEESEDLDHAMEAFLQAEILRTSLLIACENFETALSQVRQQLTLRMPAPEIDRRVRTSGDRRGITREPGREAEAETEAVVVADAQAEHDVDLDSRAIAS